VFFGYIIFWELPDRSDVMLNSILCAIDFSEFSRQVLCCGVGLARQFNADLLVCHAICFPRDQLYGTVENKRTGEHEKLARQAYQKIGKLMETAPVRWDILITFGDPVDEVARIAEEQNVDLVISASHGISGLKRILLGTVIERLARTLTCPLLVTHSPKSPVTETLLRGEITESPLSEETTSPLTFRKIVVGCDLSPDSAPGVLYGVNLAREFQGELHLLHTMETPVDEELMDSAQVHYGEVEQLLRERLTQRLIAFVSQNAPGECCLRPVLIPGHPNEEISSYAAKNNADLIIVGVRPQGILEKLLGGSTTEALLRHAPCPVLIC